MAYSADAVQKEGQLLSVERGTQSSYGLPSWHTARQEGLYNSQTVPQLNQSVRRCDGHLVSSQGTDFWWLKWVPYRQHDYKGAKGHGGLAEGEHRAGVRCWTHQNLLMLCVLLLLKPSAQICVQGALHCSAPH